MAAVLPVESQEGIGVPRLRTRHRAPHNYAGRRWPPRRVARRFEPLGSRFSLGHAPHSHNETDLTHTRHMVMAEQQEAFGCCARLSSFQSCRGFAHQERGGGHAQVPEAVRDAGQLQARAVLCCY